MNNLELYVYELREDVRKLKQKVEELEEKVKSLLEDKRQYEWEDWDELHIEVCGVPAEECKYNVAESINWLYKHCPEKMKVLEKFSKKLIELTKKEKREIEQE